MRFAIIWLEHHNPDNWGEDYEEGKKNILDRLPNAKIISIDPEDLWIEVQATDYFKAEDMESAKKYVEEHYQIDSGVFSVIDPELGCVLFTEEDL